jgi:nicotinamide mononucleotide transporter
MDSLELTAVVFGIVSVWLSTREHIGSWPTALVNVALYFVVLQRAQLYANAWLQVVYFALSCYGWYEWKYGGAQHAGVVITRTSARTSAVLGALVVAITLALYGMLTRYTDASSPWLDAGTTAVSLAAQWMMTRKLLENWIVWSVVNVVYVGMYLSQGLALSAALYAVYFGLAVSGHFAWRRSLAARLATAA